MDGEKTHMRLLLVDDHILFREGLVSLLDGQPDIEVVGETGSIQGAVKLARELAPDLILMDFTLPDGTGLEATKAILAESPETNIVFLTVHDREEYLFHAIRSGAKGYLLKNVPLSNLLSYLRGIGRGEAAISLTMVSHILEEFYHTRHASQPQSDELNSLTLREIELLQELATGASNREIARRLVISENTVKVHVRHILEKLNLKNRREAINYARQQGLI